jgi:hypothetical protein
MGYVNLILSKITPFVIFLGSFGGFGSHVIPGTFGFPVYVSLSTAANKCKKRARNDPCSASMLYSYFTASTGHLPSTIFERGESSYPPSSPETTAIIYCGISPSDTCLMVASRSPS